MWTQVEKKVKPVACANSYRDKYHGPIGFFGDEVRGFLEGNNQKNHKEGTKHDLLSVDPVGFLSGDEVRSVGGRSLLADDNVVVWLSTAEESLAVARDFEGCLLRLLGRLSIVGWGWRTHSRPGREIFSVEGCCLVVELSTFEPTCARIYFRSGVSEKTRQ